MKFFFLGVRAMKHTMDSTVYANKCLRFQDNILMPIRGEGEGLVDDGDEQAISADISRLVYVLHPNCSVEEV